MKSLTAYRSLYHVKSNELLWNASNQFRVEKWNKNVHRKKFILILDAIKTIRIECLSQQRSQMALVILQNNLFVYGFAIDEWLSFNRDTRNQFSIWMQDTDRVVYTCLIYMIWFHELECRKVHRKTSDIFYQKQSISI